MRGHPSIITVDCQYTGPEIAAAFLIVEDGAAAFVDNNTARAVPYLLEALDRHGLVPEQVEYLIVTHVHLDHAGGTAELLKHCPRATVLCHPKAVRHLAHPQRLVASSLQVYGPEVFEQLFGAVQPVPEARIRAIPDGKEISLGSRTLRFLHTLGHATHHVCVYDSRGNGVFAGDCFGLHYPSLQRGAKPYIVCSCTPTEFDPAEARNTVRRIVHTGAERAHVGHFGDVPCLSAAAVELIRSIDAMESILRDAAASTYEGEALEHYCRERVETAASRQLFECGITLRELERGRLEADNWINARGLAYAATKLRRAR
jgi:glyoxylase-like metal-dependent hydrolase (beta-lactamase superfamily II)